MIPPPAMTTSALSMTFRDMGAGGGAPAPRHTPNLEDQLQGSEGRDAAVVERRRDLDEVEPDQGGAPCGARQEIESLPRRQPAGRRDLRPRGKRGIESVDVERNVDFLARKPIGDPGHRPRRLARKLLRRHKQDSVGGDELQLLRVLIPTAPDDDPAPLPAPNLASPPHHPPPLPAPPPRPT